MYWHECAARDSRRTRYRLPKYMERMELCVCDAGYVLRATARLNATKIHEDFMAFCPGENGTVPVMQINIP
jgi:hypothetical protein